MSVIYDICRYGHTFLFLVVASQLLARALDKQRLVVVRVLDAAVAAVLLNNIYATLDLIMRGVDSGGRNVSGFITALLLVAATNGELCLKLWSRYQTKRGLRRILKQQQRATKENP